MTALLSMIHFSLFTIGCVLTVVAWIVSSFVLLYEVIGLRLNILSMLTLVGSMALIYLIFNFSRNWLIVALF